MRVLELFAGSRSFGKVAEKHGYEVFSTDLVKRKGIDLVIDILELTKDMIPFEPTVIWASPPCTSFSVGSIGKHWNKDHTPKTENAVLGMEILAKTLEIISWYPIAIYFIENPRGKMRKIIQPLHPKFHYLPITSVCYCQYGETRMKPTDIWSNNIYSAFNIDGWIPRKMCFNGNKNCHHEAAPRGSKTGTQGLKGNYERSIVPKQLCEEIIQSIL